MSICLVGGVWVGCTGALSWVEMGRQGRRGEVLWWVRGGSLWPHRPTQLYPCLIWRLDPADVVILDRQDKVAWRGVELASLAPAPREKHSLTALSGGRLLLFGGGRCGVGGGGEGQACRAAGLGRLWRGVPARPASSPACSSPLLARAPSHPQAPTVPPHWQTRGGLI